MVCSNEYIWVKQSALYQRYMLYLATLWLMLKQIIKVTK